MGGANAPSPLHFFVSRALGSLVARGRVQPRPLDRPQRSNSFFHREDAEHVAAVTCYTVTAVRARGERETERGKKRCFADYWARNSGREFGYSSDMDVSVS